MSEKEIKNKLENDNENGKEIQTEYGLVKKRELEREMRESYLDYAMSVIVSRALPDVRDGLKPVHRKILYSMSEMGLTANAKYRKSATVVGDVMGKYHPHGDTAIYDTLARMAQDYSMRYMLVNGQGNFGSIDGDAPAAMRYTECKMQKITEEILADIDKDTVNFIDNFDGSRQEPVVLPSKIPQLLVNGTMGIAVGMATDIPPHNLTEVCNATIALIENPEASIDDLLEYVKGPDFPTGGEIYDIEEIKNAYATGKGKVLMRGVSEIEEGKRGSFRIKISQIPYRVNKAVLIEKIAQLVKDKKIKGITDIRDESDKEGIRVIIELKKDSYPQKILNQLYKFTQLQDTFHVNMLALIDGIKPQVLNLKTILEEFIKHRQQVVYRRTQFELKQAEARLHILQGLKIALDAIDEVIETIKKSESRSAAEKNLIQKFKLTQIQANAILEMRLSALAKLEREKVEKEIKELNEKIKELKAILEDPKKILEIIKNELKEIISKFGDERKTKLYKRGINKISQEDLIPNERVFINLTKGNYIKRLPTSTYRSQARGGKGVIGITTKEEDFVEHMLVCMNHDEILFFTNKGRVFSNRAYEIMQGSRQSKGQAIVNLLQIDSDEKVTAIINISAKDKPRYLMMATEKGQIKKTSIIHYKKVRKSGLITMRLKKGDYLHWVKPTSGNDQVIMVSKLGQAIRFHEKGVRPMGRSAGGVRGMRLREGDGVVGMETVAHSKDLPKQEEEIIQVHRKKSLSSDLLVVTELGKGKRTALKYYNLQMRGGIGLRTARITEKTGSIVQARLVEGTKNDLVIISQKGQVIRMPLKQVKPLGRSTSGVQLIKLNKGDKVASVTMIQKEVEEEILEKSSGADEKLEKESGGPNQKKNVSKKGIQSKKIFKSQKKSAGSGKKNKGKKQVKIKASNKKIFTSKKSDKKDSQLLKPKNKLRKEKSKSEDKITSAGFKIKKIDVSEEREMDQKSEKDDAAQRAEELRKKQILNKVSNEESKFKSENSSRGFVKKKIVQDKNQNPNYWGSDFWKKKKF